MKAERFSKEKPFVFTDDNLLKAQAFLKNYPEGRGQSALSELLELAQTQNGGWLSQGAIEYVANYLNIAPIKVLEFASFYDAFHLKPVASYRIQTCSTPPCWLSGSDVLIRACKKWLGVDVNGMTEDGKFSLEEVDCLGHCTKAPVVSVNGDIHEDMTEEKMITLLNQCVGDR